MISYEGMSYNLETIIQFQALKQLLEALVKKQIAHNIILYGQNKDLINIYNENKTENLTDIDNNKENNIIENEKENYFEKINNIGLINDYIESKNQLNQHKVIIEELKSRIEELEKRNIKENKINNFIEKKDDIHIQKTNIKKEPVNNNEKKDIVDNIDNNINNLEKKDEKIEIINNDNKSINEFNNSQNLDELLSNIKEKITNSYELKEEKYLKDQINTLENNYKTIKTQIEKIQTQVENNKKSIDSSKNEIIQYKKIIQKLNEQNDLDNKLDVHEKKLIKILEAKIKELLNAKLENLNIKTFIAEKEKIKEDNEKILLEIKNLIDKNAEFEDKIKDLPNISFIKRLEEKIKLVGLEMEDYATKNDIKHIYNELDKYENELSKLKSFVISQNEVNAKYREDILKIKNSFDNIKKTFSAINKLFENNSLSQIIENLNDISYKMVEKEEYNEAMKEINKTIYNLKIDVNDHNRILDSIMPLIQKILTMEDLNKFENTITDLIEKQSVDAKGKFADKKEIVKSIQSIESQVKMFMKNLEKEREKEKNEGAILASKPVGGYKCASCEAYIGELKESYTYLPWNKIQGAEKPYRLGSSFSRILQGLNIDNTFNPFIQKPMLKSDNDKKYKLSENCLSIKKVKKIAPLIHVNSDIDVMKKQSIEETFEKDSYNTSKKKYKNKLNLWGIKTLRNYENEANILNKSKSKEINLSRNNLQHNKEIEKVFGLSKRVIRSKINNTSEDIENQF